MTGPMLHREINVALPGAPSRVLVGCNLLGEAGRLVREAGLAGPAVVVTDSKVGPLHAAPVLESLEAAGIAASLVEIPAGEQSKSLAVAGEVCDAMIARGLDRNSFVLALGGGVVGDLAGFAAAIYYRGVPCVQVPTTIVAQVDSSVGGKTGVNATAGKNLLGAFHQPVLVLADVAVLATLPDREYREGFAEVIKHAVIADAAMLDLLDPEAPRSSLAPLIARNVSIKAAIVAEDEHETSGRRALLNFGHTVGHAIENVAGYGRFLHGEAVSLGLAAALAISVRRAGLDAGEAARVRQALARFHLPLTLPRELATEDLMAAARRDKKFSAGRVRFVLCPRLGEAQVSEQVTEDDIRQAVEALRV